jgi:hypothetical protein
MLKVIFVLIIVAWLFIGFLSNLHCKENRVNYELIVFVLFVPFIPLLAKACGLI